MFIRITAISMTFCSQIFNNEKTFMETKSSLVKACRWPRRNVWNNVGGESLFFTPTTTTPPSKCNTDITELEMELTVDAT